MQGTIDPDEDVVEYALCSLQPRSLHRREGDNV